MISEMNERSREIMRLIVEAYTETGSAVGSRTLSRRLDLPLSPATICNVMADLEDLGLYLFATYLGGPSADGRRTSNVRRRFT